MSDQTPDPTAWSDDQLDNLLDALAERAAERDDLNLPGGGTSRRGVLAGLLGLGGAAAGAGVASAIGESESYGSSTGVVGTDSEPVSEANVQNLHAKNAQIDSLLEAQKLAVATGGVSVKSTEFVGSGFSDRVRTTDRAAEPPAIVAANNARISADGTSERILQAFDTRPTGTLTVTLLDPTDPTRREVYRLLVAGGTATGSVDSEARGSSFNASFSVTGREIFITVSESSDVQTTATLIGSSSG